MHATATILVGFGVGRATKSFLRTVASVHAAGAHMEDMDEALQAAMPSSGSEEGMESSSSGDDVGRGVHKSVPGVSGQAERNLGGGATERAVVAASVFMQVEPSDKQVRSPAPTSLDAAMGPD